MDEIIVKVSDLEMLVAALKSHHMDYVNLVLAEECPGCSALLIPEAMSEKNADVVYDFDPIEASSSANCSFDFSLPLISITI